MLKKRYMRNIKANPAFYICMMLLTMITGMLYLDFTVSSQVFRKELDTFYQEDQVEDAQFTTKKALHAQDIKELEEKYTVKIEAQKYVDMEQEKGKILRVFAPSEKINQYRISKGNALRSDQDMLVNAGYLKANRMEIGTKILFDGKEDAGFTIAGEAQRPDYLFPLKELTDTYALKKKFGVATVTKEAFQKLEKSGENVHSYYAICYGKKNVQEVRDALQDGFSMTSYTKADANARILTPKNELKETAEIMKSVVLLLIIFLTIIVAVVLGRKIRNDRKQIGVLLALGYRKRELKRHYAVYGILSGLLGGILAIIAAQLFKNKAIHLMFLKMDPIPVTYKIHVGQMLLVLMVPVLLYATATYRAAAKVMKTDVITVLSGRRNDQGKNIWRMSKSRLGVKNRFKLRQIFGKPGRSAILLAGFILSGVLYVFCAACIDSMDYYVKNTVGQIGSFEYEYFLKTPGQGTVKNASAMLGAEFEVKNRKDMLLLLGTDDARYMNLTNKEGKKLTFQQDRYYLTTMAALAFDVKEGEDISFFDPVTLKEYKVTITDIVKNDAQAAIYSSRKNVGKLLGLPKDTYNVVMSEQKMNYTSNELNKTITKTALSNQIREVKKGMEELMGGLTGFSILICILVVYMMIHILVTEEAPNISMLKVLGFRKKEINAMVLHVYHLLVPVGMILSLLIGVWATNRIYHENVAVYKTYIETKIYLTSVLKFIGLMLGSYSVSLWLLRGKVNRIGMVESLKDNRE